ncbi:hypothetical protein [Streptomyces silaceus]|uniref:hypothetical protein n=1 Tax=Streptomyces silaceus TaxID=545123 RepID=UPI0006EBA299|nr:hypothetical protein [Streptomyces silaceus]
MDSKKDVPPPRQSNGSAQNSPAGRSDKGGGRGSSGAGTDSRKGPAGSGKGGAPEKSGGRGRATGTDRGGATGGGGKGATRSGSEGATKSPRKDATGGGKGTSSGGATRNASGSGPKGATGGGSKGAGGGGTSGSGDRKSGAQRGADGGASGGGKKVPLRKDAPASGGGRGGAGSKSDGKSGPGSKGSGASGASGSGPKGSGSGSGSGAGGPKGQGAGGSKGSGASGAGKDGGPGKQGKDGKPGKDSPSSSGSVGHGAGQSGKQQGPSLQKSREIGHGDGGRARRVVDHVKAYADGARDGWRDEKDKNAREHDRLDKAHDEHKGKPSGRDKTPAKSGPIGRTRDDDQPTTKSDKPAAKDTDDLDRPFPIAAEDEDEEPMEDPFMSQPTPIQAKGVDASRITFPASDAFTKTSISRGELRCFIQYEGRLEARIDGLAKVSEATKQLAAQAHEQADDCQKLAEEGKGVEGGDDLVAELATLAEKAKVQADEADEVHARAARAHDFAKAVLSNVQGRYRPLYQAVVDSKLTKPAEMRFYADRGIYPSDLALSA